MTLWAVSTKYSNTSHSVLGECYLLLPLELRDSCLGSKPWSKKGVLNFLKHLNEGKKFIPVSPALSGCCLDVFRFTNPWISTQLHLEESPRTQSGLPHSAHQLGTQSGCPTSPCDYSILAAIALTSYCRNLTTKAAPIQHKYQHIKFVGYENYVTTSRAGTILRAASFQITAEIIDLALNDHCMVLPE